MLSPYEFAKHYHLKPARHPYSEEGQRKEPEEEEGQHRYHAGLTDAGIAKCNRNKGKAMKDRERLVAGTDYQIREEGGKGWLPLGKGKRVAAYRHDWIIVPRRRPYVPVLYGAQGARTEDEQAMRILTVFFPWVSHAEDATPQVPFINDFWQAGMQSWSEALLSHASRVGFPTVEVKRMVMSYGFTYCLPREMRLKDGLQENSDNEGLKDELVDLALSENELLEATLTHVRGKAGQDQGDDESDDAGEGQELCKTTKLHDMTMEMFGISEAIWHKQPGAHNEAARARHAEFEGSGDKIRDPNAAKQAAKQSQAKAKANKDAHTGLIGDVKMPSVEDS